MRLGAVIVTYRSGRVLPGLLATLDRYEPEIDAVVVDSGTPDGPPDVPAPARLLALTENVGFGASCNRGSALLSEAEFLVFLNPDVRLIGPSLTELLAGMELRPATGIATGPITDPSGRRVPSAWGPPSIWRAAWAAAGLELRRFRTILGLLSAGLVTSSATLIEDEVAVGGHVLGGAMVVRRDCWEQLGGFDEDYFLYWEDADLCHRARQLGWEVRVLPCTPIVHEAGTSSEGVLADQRWQWYVEGAVTFARKHLSPGRGRRLLGALRWGRRLRR